MTERTEKTERWVLAAIGVQGAGALQFAEQLRAA